ncbi:MAG: hypothetical protein M1839_000871 [Geoglossum umbratile]|nr:MAG: hypothetical protein M1839_000871 [Geoglossum umbratile]
MNLLRGKRQPDGDVLEAPVQKKLKEKNGLFFFRQMPSDKEVSLLFMALEAMRNILGRMSKETSGCAIIYRSRSRMLELVMSYGYDSVIAFSASVGGINHIAADLLNRLNDERETVQEKTRPIVFICHSLGGIIFKKVKTILFTAAPITYGLQSLILAHERSSEYSNISEMVRGVVFMGTPHRGSDVAYWGNFLSCMLRIAQLGLKGNNNLLVDLKQNSKALSDISQQFIERGKLLQIRTFYEIERLGPIIITDEDSARLNLPNEIAVPIQANHSTMCKFSSADSQKYRSVWKAVKRLVELSWDGIPRDTDKLSQPVTTLDVRPLAKQDELLSKLPRAYGAAINSYPRQHEPSCLPDTRVDLFRQLSEWNNNLQGKCLFWLNGMAGTGKSTIARTVAREGSEQNRLGASFFFSKGGGDRGHACMFFSTLALQLAEMSPDLKRYICEAIAGNQDIGQHGLSEQWQKLVFRPLLKLNSSQIPMPIILLVIDALDECENQDDARLILRLLAEAKGLQTIQLRVFVTSRPEFSILQEFRAIPTAAYHDFILHNISQSDIEHDISVFVKKELAQICSEKELSTDWPGRQIIKLLVDRASGLFIYIATVCRFVGKSKFPERRLNEIIQGSETRQGPEQNLDMIYAQILRDSLIGDSIDQDRVELIDLFRQTVGPVVIIFDLLSITALSKLLSIELSNIKGILYYLRSVLDVPDKEESPIKLLHPSFRDFLLNKERCRDEQFWIAEHKAHSDLCNCCLQLMSNTLDRDICGLKKPGALASEVRVGTLAQHLPSHVQYACRYWVGHLQKLTHDQREEVGLYEKVQIFIERHFLHWLEALSLMRKISEGIIMITDLQSILMSSEMPQLLAIVKDAKRFILYYGSIIKKAPLQVYASALVFSPKTSLIKQRFLDQGPAWIHVWPAVDEHWSPSQPLEGHTDGVNCVTYSPNGQQLASSSHDRTIRLWDAATGALQGTLEGHTHIVQLVTYSPNGRWLASASNDCTIRLWDATTGVLQRTLEGHSDWVSSVTYSPDGQCLASASGDCTIRFWDAETGALQRTLRDHNNSVYTAIYSPDGRWLASASDDGNIRLWVAATGAFWRLFKGHSYWSCLTFSPNGRWLASAADDGIILLWDTAIGVLEDTLEGHSGQVNSMTFSPDGLWLASAADDNTILLWDPTIGVLERTLEGHSGSVFSMAFSTDGRQLASASYDRTIRLWDAATGALQRTLKGHSGWVNSVMYSPDGRRLASASSDCTIMLWDTTIGDLQRTLEGHTDFVSYVTYSPDRRSLASASHDCTIMLWDTATGTLQRTLEGHDGPVNSVIFSPDGRRVASASDDCTIMLWDAATGELQRVLEGHSGSVHFATFSPDRRRVASASSDRTNRLWDARTGALQRTLESHSN